MTTSDGKHDTRRFLTPRLSSLHDYLTFPLLKTEVNFTSIPKFTIKTARLVSVGLRTWELWSPNSRRFPFYPGVSPREISWSKDLPIRERRTDGHIGRFDPTISPQEYGAQPWFPLIHRSVPEGFNPDNYPEFGKITLLWRHEPQPHTTTGSLSSTFLRALYDRNQHLNIRMNACQGIQKFFPDWWTSRPPTLLQSDFQRWRGLQQFEHVVDGVTRLQRIIKVKAAWVEFAERRQTNRRETHQPTFDRVPEANDQLMGVWANTTSQKELDWMLKQRIPCFFIHECSRDELVPRSDVAKFYDFLEGSEAIHLTPQYNPLENIAVRREQALPTLSICMPPPSEDRALALPTTHSTKSSPRYLGWEDPGPEKREEMDWNTSREMIPDISSSSNRTTKSFQTNSLDLVSLYADRVAWIRPPSIYQPKEADWTRWKQDLDDSEECLPCVRDIGKKQKQEGFIYYDRENRRSISFDSALEPPPGLSTEVDIFGLPAPDIPFESRLGNKFRPTERSKWLYKTRLPKSPEIGKIPEAPRQHQLPFKKSTDTVLSLFSPWSYREDPSEVDADEVQESPIPLPISPVRNESESPEPGPSLGTPSRTSSPMRVDQETPYEIDEVKENAAQDARSPYETGELLPRIDSPCYNEDRMDYDQTIQNEDGITTFLAVSGAPLMEVSWEDFLAYIENIQVISDECEPVRIYHTISDEDQTFWLEMLSRDEALLANVKLTSQLTADGVQLLCKYLTQEEFQTAAVDAINYWRGSSVTKGKRRRSSSPSTSERSYPSSDSDDDPDDRPPHMTSSSGLAARLRDSSPQFRVPLEQRISNETRQSLSARIDSPLQASPAPLRERLVTPRTAPRTASGKTGRKHGVRGNRAGKKFKKD